MTCIVAGVGVNGIATAETAAYRQRRHFRRPVAHGAIAGGSHGRDSDPEFRPLPRVMEGCYDRIRFGCSSTFERRYAAEDSCEQCVHVLQRLMPECADMYALRPIRFRPMTGRSAAPPVREEKKAPMPDFRVRRPKVHHRCYINVLGTQSVNGSDVVSTRTLEFILAIALAGGECRKSALERDLFSDCSSKSAIPTLAYRARKMGIGTEFVPARASYRTTTEVVVDAVELLKALRRGDIRTALWLYGGPCLANSRSPLAVETRDLIDMRLMRALLATGDEALIGSAAVKLGRPELRWAG